MEADTEDVVWIRFGDVENVSFCGCVLESDGCKIEFRDVSVLMFSIVGGMIRISIKQSYNYTV